MNEFWFQARIRPIPRSVVVLDVSTAAAPYWPALRNAVERLDESLPPTAHPDVAFLGSPERISLARFRRTAEQLHDANSGRGRVLSPLLESFPDAWPERILLLAARPIIDLDDWRHTPHASRLVVARADSTVSIADGACTEIELTDFDTLTKLMIQPPPSAQIRLPGGIPFAWDNPSFRFDVGALLADPGEGGDIRVGFLCAANEAAPVAELMQANAPISRLSIMPTAPLQALPWFPFTAPEFAVLDAWRGGRSAYCSRCGNDHAPGEVACPTGSEVLLPSLAKLLPGGFVRVSVSRASYQPVPSPALRIGEAIVVRAPAGAMPTVWRFEASRGEWMATAEPWRLFEPLESNDEFALAMPPVRRGGDS